MIKSFKHKGIAFERPDTIRRVQEKLLAKQLAYCLKYSPYYQMLIKRVRLGKGKSALKVLADIPFTQKRDLEKYNDKFLAVKPEQIVDIVLSSGTTGQPTRMMYSEVDLLIALLFL